MSRELNRNSNHELLRLLAMYMIVFIHANMYLGTFCTGKYNVFFNGLVNGICNIGVSCFILISGYYGVKFNIGKLVKMECMMIVFSLLETVMLFIAFPEQMRGAVLLEQLVKSLLPFITRKYWFYSCYVCLMLFSGYIQKFIEFLNREVFEKLLMLMLVLFSVFPTLFYFELIPDNGKGLVQMIMVYMIGRYISMYHDIQVPRGKAFALFVLLWIINGVSHEIPIRIGGIYHHLCKDNSITNLTMAVLLFYLFKGMDVRSGLINKAASYIFAVFALNNSLVLVVMEYLRGQSEFRRPGGVFGFLTLACIVLLVFIICLLIGLLRDVLLGGFDRKLGDKMSTYIKAHLVTLEKSIMSKVERK